MPVKLVFREHRQSVPGGQSALPLRRSMADQLHGVRLYASPPDGETTLYTVTFDPSNYTAFGSPNE
jgi:hypothetical protein